MLPLIFVSSLIQSNSLQWFLPVNPKISFSIQPCQSFEALRMPKKTNKYEFINPSKRKIVIIFIEKNQPKERVVSIYTKNKS